MEQQVNFHLSKAKTGVHTASVEVGSRPAWFLHSTVDPLQEAADWLARVELTPHTAYFVLGFGLGYHVEALLKHLPEGCHIYVLEYSKEVNLFNVAVRLFASNSWMHDPRITYFATGEFRELAVSLAVDMGKRCINKVTLCRYYPAMAIFPEFFQQLETELVQRVEESFCLNFNNSITQGIRRIQNAWYNAPYISHSPGIAPLANRFAGMPAIVVAAGPSLNKNIEVLKTCIGKALVIAAGSAMGALHANGITPDFLAVSEARAAMYEDDLAGVLDPETILLTIYDAQHKVVSEYPGRMMFAIDQTTATLDCVKHLLPETGVLRQSINVATMAFSFAQYCGANPIVFVGQDLSFSPDSNEAQHAMGVQAGDYSKEEWQQTMVPGYDGGEVPTVLQMREVIQYFESLIRRNPQTTFINATEGGARIGGTMQMKLSEVYERYLTRDLLLAPFLDELYQQFVPRNYDELLRVLKRLREEIARERQGAEVFIAGIVKEMEAVSDWNADEYDRLEGQFVRLFAEVSQTALYPYIKLGIAPFQELAEYRIREGMTPQQRIDVYFQLRNDLLIVLECLDSAVQEGLQRMETIHGDWAEARSGEGRTNG